jgi:hypothetical protein
MMERSSAPTEQHKALGVFVGEFSQTSEVRLGPGEPIKARAVGVGRWTMGGRLVEVRSESAPEETLKGERLVIYGYDPMAKKYMLTNFDSLSYTATTALGDYDPASKTFTFEGSKDQPGGNKMPFRWVLKVQPDGAILQQVLVQVQGKEFLEVVTVKHTPKRK